LTAITSAIVNITAPKIKNKSVGISPIDFSARITISNMAADIRMPAPNAVKNNRTGFEKCTYFPINAPRKEVPPANNVIPITIKISVNEIGVDIFYYSNNSD
jgi:hypothetical protein